MNNNFEKINNKYLSYFNEEIFLSEQKTKKWGILKKIKISLSLFLYAFLIKDFYIFDNFRNPQYYNSSSGAILTFFKRDICKESKLVKITNIFIVFILSILSFSLFLASLNFFPFYSFTSLFIAFSLSIGTGISFSYFKNTRQLVFASLYKSIRAVFNNNVLLNYYYMKGEAFDRPINQEKLSTLLNSDLRGKEHPVFVNMLVNKDFTYITLKDLNKVNVEYIWKRNDMLDVLLDKSINNSSYKENKSKDKIQVIDTQKYRKAAEILSTLN